MEEKVTHFSDVVHMEYRLSPGKVIGRFLSELKENGKIFGIREGMHGHVFVPPQKFCPYSGNKLEEWVELSGQGIVEYYTVVHENSPFADWKPPYALAGIRLDGAYTILWHRMKNSKSLKSGQKVSPVFKPKEERIGSILDIDHFVVSE